MSACALDRERLEKILGPAWPFVNQVYDELPLGVTIADSGGIAAYLNRAQLEIDGLKPKDVLGRFLCDIYAPYTVSVILNCLSAQKPILNHWQVYDSPVNKDIHAVNHAFPLFRDGRLSGCLAMVKNYPKTEVDSFRRSYISEDVDIDRKVGTGLSFKNLVGLAPAFKRAIQVARTAAEHHLPVMIHGETGVGKELFARGLHNASARKDKPFVAVNCSAIPDNLFEGLMFGVTKGAFTGAVERPGFFEEANGGSIYLDEIDSMPLSLQPKVLRVLQEGEVRRLGSRRDIPIDVKVISSMSQDPLVMVDQGRFRSDLFFRLGAILISVPPLRERPGDIPLLLNHFITKHAKPLGKKIQRASADFIDILNKSQWPGNVREFEHVVSGAITLAAPRRQTLGPDLLPEYFKNIIFMAQGRLSPYGGEAEPPEESEAHAGARRPADFVRASFPTAAAPPMARHNIQVANDERVFILEHLEKSFGNVALAARLMGLSPQLLHYKIRKHGLSAHDFKLPPGRG